MIESGTELAGYIAIVGAAVILFSLACRWAGMDP